MSSVCKRCQRLNPNVEWPYCVKCEVGLIDHRQILEANAPRLREALKDHLAWAEGKNIDESELLNRTRTLLAATKAPPTKHGAGR